MEAHYKYEDQLQSERLLTRFLSPDDISIWSDFFKDKDATAFFPDIPFSTDEAKSKWWIERQLTRYKENRFGLQAIIHKQTGDFVGQCGLLIQEVDGKEEIEIGYDIFKKYWGQGYASEAAKMFIEYAFQNNLTNSIIAIINSKNVRAQRVAEKVGLTMENETQWSDINVKIFRVRSLPK